MKIKLLRKKNSRKEDEKKTINEMLRAVNGGKRTSLDDPFIFYFEGYGLRKITGRELYGIIDEVYKKIHPDQVCFANGLELPAEERITRVEIYGEYHEYVIPTEWSGVILRIGYLKDNGWETDIAYSLQDEELDILRNICTVQGYIDRVKERQEKEFDKVMNPNYKWLETQSTPKFSWAAELWKIWRKFNPINR